MKLDHVFSSYVLIITTIMQKQCTEVFSIAGIKTQFPVYFCLSTPFKKKQKYPIGLHNEFGKGKNEGKPDLK